MGPQGVEIVDPPPHSEEIARRFIWFQFDLSRQCIYFLYLRPSQKCALGYDTMLKCVQFSSKNRYDVKLDIALPLESLWAGFADHKVRGPALAQRRARLMFRFPHHLHCSLPHAHAFASVSAFFPWCLYLYIFVMILARFNRLGGRFLNRRRVYAPLPPTRLHGLMTTYYPHHLTTITTFMDRRRSTRTHRARTRSCSPPSTWRSCTCVARGSVSAFSTPRRFQQAKQQQPTRMLP